MREDLKDLTIEDVGLDLSGIKTNESPFYIKSLQIFNTTKSEKELEYYCGILSQAQKTLDIIKD